MLKTMQRETAGINYKSFKRHWSSTAHKIIRKRGDVYILDGVNYSLKADEIRLARDDIQPITKMRKDLESKPEVIRRESPKKQRDERAERAARRNQRRAARISPPRPKTPPPRPKTPPGSPPKPPPKVEREARKARQTDRLRAKAPPPPRRSRRIRNQRERANRRFL